MKVKQLVLMSAFLTLSKVSAAEVDFTDFTDKISQSQESIEEKISRARYKLSQENKDVERIKFSIQLNKQYQQTKQRDFEVTRSDYANLSNQISNAEAEIKEAKLQLQEQEQEPLHYRCFKIYNERCNDYNGKHDC